MEESVKRAGSNERGRRMRASHIPVRQRGVDGAARGSGRDHRREKRRRGGGGYGGLGRRTCLLAGR
jgi:hypothetical protein